MRHEVRTPSTLRRTGLGSQRRHLLACALASCFSLVGTQAMAQSTAATLRGHAATAAEITATNTETGFTRTVIAGEDGSYALPGLPPGTYRIEAESGDFSDTQTVTLRVGQTATLDLALAAVTEMESVEVVATQVIESRTSEIANYVSPEQIQALPQNARNFLAFADIVPGVRFDERADGTSQLRGGAQSSNGVNVFIDGVGQKNYVLRGGISSQDSSRGSPFPQLAIAEYKVISQNYKAEFDQLSSVAIAAVTRSGTNEFEGSVFYDRTTDDWRASSPRELADDNKVESKDEQYGVSFGGPIVRDLLHFFVSYEAKEIVSPREVTIGEGVPITALPAELASQVGVYNSPFEMDLLFGKLSWAPGDAHLLELSAKYRDESEITGVSGINTPSYASSKDNEELRLDLHHQFNGEGFLNDAHITFEDASWNPRPTTDAPGYRLVASAQDRRGILNAGGNGDFQDKGQRGFGLQNDLTFYGIEWRGDHTIKMGAKYKSIRIDAYEQQPYNPQFEYDFRHSFTIPYQVTFGASVPGGGDRSVSSRNQQFGIYLQDDWAVNDRLLLNFGLRWDYEKTPEYLDFVLRPGLAAALRGWSNIQNTDYDIEDYISDGSNREAFKDAWQPRVGFSYDVSGDERHVVFGGAGRAYDRNLFEYLALEQLKGTFPSYTFQFNAPGNPCSGATCLNFDPSFFNAGTLAALVAANPNLGGETNLVNNHLKTPYSDQFSLGMRNAFGDWNSSVTLSHVRSYDGIVFTLGNRYPDGSFRPAGTTWGNAPWGHPIPGYGTLLLIDNGIETRLNALLVSLEKPFTQESGWGTTFAYTLNDAEENRPNAAQFDEHYVFDYADVADIGWKRSLGIPRHRIVATGMLQGPWDMMYSAKLVLESANTYDATNCYDAVDFNHCFFDPYTPPDTLGRKQVDIAVSKDWAFGDGYAMNFRIDVINVFNHRNWNDFNNWRGGPNEPNPDFGDRGLGIQLPTRTLKASLGFTW